jgi:hypothetical protein
MRFPTPCALMKVASCGAGIRELSMLDGVDYRQVIPTAQCNNLIEQSHRPTRGQERSQLGFRQVKRAQWAWLELGDTQHLKSLPSRALPGTFSSILVQIEAIQHAIQRLERLGMNRQRKPVQGHPAAEMRLELGKQGAHICILRARLTR